MFCVVTVPVLILLLIIIQYRRYDLYKDFGAYPNYSWTYYFQSLGDISTKKLLHSKIRYNTFIFGSSRTTSLYACYVQRKLQGSRAFHYGNWNESIGGILEKVKLLDSLGYPLSHVVIYIDTDHSFEGDGSVKPYDHYLLTHHSRRHARIDHFQSFISEPGNIALLFGGTPSKEEFPGWHSDPITNDPTHICSDSSVTFFGIRNLSKADSSKIDSLKRCGFLYKRSETQQYRESQISAGENSMIHQLSRILRQHRSNYYVVITPLYDQRKFSREDMAILKEAYGSNLYDFSGINPMTNDAYNYPDRTHFIENVSKQIIDSIIIPN